MLKNGFILHLPQNSKKFQLLRISENISSHNTIELLSHRFHGQQEQQQQSMPVRNMGEGPLVRMALVRMKC